MSHALDTLGFGADSKLSKADTDESFRPAVLTATSSRFWKSKPSVRYHGYSEEWPPFRLKMGRFFSSKVFDSSLGVCLLMNMVLLVLETDYNAAEGKEKPVWIPVVNFLLITVYFLELVCRIFVYRRDFFVSLHNWADMCIISVDVCVEILIVIVGDSGLPSIVFLRIFRLVRLGRTHRALVMFPELNILVLGLAGALKAIFWGMILLTIVLIAWGILAVQIIHPLNVNIADAGAYDSKCERCHRAFESVGAAILTFTQQIIAGDSWGEISVPIIESYPWAFIFFGAVLSTLGMTVLNLILAVVIDSAVGARRETDHQLALQKEQEFIGASSRLWRLCRDLDTNGDGAITLPELREGCTNNADFADTMRAMDLRPADMETIFKILDVDQSGDVPYDEFVDELFKLKTYEPHTLLVFTKFYCTEIHAVLVKEMKMLKESLKLMHTIEDNELEINRTAHGDVDLLDSSTLNGNPKATALKDLSIGGEAKGSTVLAGTGPEMLDRVTGCQEKAISQSYDVSFLRESTEQVLNLLREVAKDVRMNGRILGSLDDTCFLRGTLLGKQVEEGPPPSNVASYSQPLLSGTSHASPPALAVGSISGASHNLLTVPSERSGKPFAPACCQCDSANSLPPVSYL